MCRWKPLPATQRRRAGKSGGGGLLAAGWVVVGAGAGGVRVAGRKTGVGGGGDHSG
jgi:hypothetical protein